MNAEVCCGEEFLDREINSAFACDLMSDVLAYVTDQAVLLTGLVNPQVIRTAMMLDMVCIVFVRSKEPSEEMLALAKENGIVMMSTNKTLYNTCGLLYSNGLVGTAEVSK